MSQFKRENQLKNNAMQTNQQASTNPEMSLAIRNRKQMIKNSRKNNNKPRPRNNRRKQNISHAARILSGSPHPCVTHYASALCDPEGTPSGACIPYGFPVPTQKIKVMQRGTMVVGTTGQGYVTASLGIANDATVVISTTAASVGTGATVLTAFSNLTGTTLFKLPYTSTQLNADSTGRVVALGLKARYTGTESARNGTVTTFELPSNATQRPGGTAFSTLQQEAGSKSERPSPLGTWHSVNYSGPKVATQASLGPQSLWNAFTAELVILVDGVAGDKYEWEIFGHYEFSGTNIPGMSSTHSDMGMFGKVVESIKSFATSEPLSDGNNRSAFGKFFADAGSSLYSYVKEKGMSLAIDTVSSALLPRGLGFQPSKLLLKG